MAVSDAAQTKRLDHLFEVALQFRWEMPPVVSSGG
jgi:hypothetical protein